MAGSAASRFDRTQGPTFARASWIRLRLDEVSSFRAHDTVSATNATGSVAWLLVDRSGLLADLAD